MYAKSKNIISTAAVLAVASFGFAASAQAGPSWSNPSGSADTYMFSNGNSDNGSYDDPTVVNDSLLFTPANYIAESDGNTTYSDTLNVTLDANPGLAFNNISFALGGDYAVLPPASGGSGGSDAALAPNAFLSANAVLSTAVAGANAVLTVQNLDTSESLSTPLVSENYSEGDGLFSLNNTLNLPGGWSHILVKLSGDLFADADQGSAAIQFKTAGVDASTTSVVPIPAAAFGAPFLLIGGLAASKRFATKR